MVWMTSIEDAILWLHIGEIESLRVGIETVQAVVRRTDVPVVKAWSVDVVFLPSVWSSQLWIIGVLVAFTIIAICILGSVVFGDDVARPALWFLVAIPFYWIVYVVRVVLLAVAVTINTDNAVSAFQFRKLQSSESLVGCYFVLVGVDFIRTISVSVVAAAAGCHREHSEESE